jgi:hypothetical protein
MHTFQGKMDFMTDADAAGPGTGVVASQRGQARRFSACRTKALRDRRYAATHNIALLFPPNWPICRPELLVIA